MPIFMMSPGEVALHLAKQAKAKRLSLNLTQQTLAQRAGVSYGVLKKFECTGQISLISILKIALVLKSLEEFKDLFSVDKLQNITSLDQLLKEKKVRARKRGRK